VVRRDFFFSVALHQGVKIIKPIRIFIGFIILLVVSELVSVHKGKSLSQNVRVRGFDELKIIVPIAIGMTDLKFENNE